MKRNLRLRGCYTQIICIFRCLKPRYNSLLAVLTIMCLEARAQSPEESGAATPGKLNVGDTIPEYLWHLPLQVANHPEGKKTITLGDYRGKLIILDFWATFCIPCLRVFPKQDSLQSRFQPNVIFLRTTSQAKHIIPDSIYSVVEDEYLRQIFPHRLIPHYVWISPSGHILATTADEAIEEKNIVLALANQSLEIKPKRDRDKNQLLLTDTDLSDSLLAYALLYRGKLEGYGSESAKRKSNGVFRGRALTNRKILNLYMAAMIPLFDELGDQYSQKRNRLPENLDTAYYSLDIVVPAGQEQQLYTRLLRLLNESSSYEGRIEKQMAPCLVLQRADSNQTIATKGGKPVFSYPEEGFSITNYPLSYLVNALNGNTHFSSLPVVDETGYTGRVDITLQNINSLPAIQRDLRAQGLKLTESKRPLNLFILTAKP